MKDTRRPGWLNGQRRCVFVCPVYASPPSNPLSQIDIFSKDVILIPINHNNAHWTGAAINFRHKRIESYDSMNMDRSQVFKVSRIPFSQSHIALMMLFQYLRSYLDAEHRNKKKKPFDFTGWQDYTFEVRTTICNSLHQVLNGMCRIHRSRRTDMTVVCLHASSSNPYQEENSRSRLRKRIWAICGDVWCGRLDMQGYVRIRNILEGFDRFPSSV